MKNEFVLLFVECPQTDDNRQKAEAERIPEMVHIEHFAVKNTASEHIGYRVKRVCHKSHFYKAAGNVELINMVENRGEVEQKHTEYLIEIFNILEEHFKGTENQTYADAQNKQNYNRNGRKENVAVDNRRFVREEIEIDNETGKHGQ